MSPRRSAKKNYRRMKIATANIEIRILHKISELLMYVNLYWKKV